MLFLFEISSLWEVWSFCSSNFKFFANILKLKNELLLLRVVHYENDERALISTHTFFFIYVNLYVYVYVQYPRVDRLLP